MSKYAIIIDERDEPKFKKIQYANLNHDPDQNYVWGLKKKNKELWKKIKKNDVVYLSMKNDFSFNIKGVITYTKYDPKYAVKIWGKNFRSSTMGYLLYFKIETIEPIGYSKLLGSDNMASRDSGIFVIGQTPKNKISKKLDPIDMIVPEQFNCETIRYIRDTNKSKDLKKLYNDRCQVCSYFIKINSIKQYSEVHHIRPLHEGGNDSYNNMIVLCPTHHAEFDYRVIGISKNCKNIIDQNENIIYELFMNDAHNISKENIKYQIMKLREMKSR